MRRACAGPAWGAHAKHCEGEERGNKHTAQWKQDEEAPRRARSGAKSGAIFKVQHRGWVGVGVGWALRLVLSALRCPFYVDVLTWYCGLPFVPRAQRLHGTRDEEKGLHACNSPILYLEPKWLQ